MATAKLWKSVRDIIRNEPNLLGVVVSAMGKRFKGDIKITDLLETIFRKRAKDNYFGKEWESFKERFIEIATELDLDIPSLENDLEGIFQAIHAGCSRAWLVSRGEYLTAKLFAQYCKIKFYDPYDFILMTDGGKPLLRESVDGLSRPFITAGFYGKKENGELGVFSRGGSDLTVFWLAAVFQADCEKWTDTPLKFTNPDTIPLAYVVEEVLPLELRDITKVVPNILHPLATQMCIEYGINLCIKDTQNPEAPGTRIVSKRDLQRKPVVGIHLQGGYVAFSLEQAGINGEVGHINTLGSIFKDLNIPVHTSLGMGDAFVSVVHKSYLSDAKLIKIENIIKKHHLFNNPKVTIRKELSFVSIVGRGMINEPGYFARAFTKLAKQNVSVPATGSLPGEGSIGLFVEDKDADIAIKSLYSEFS